MESTASYLLGRPAVSVLVLLFVAGAVATRSVDASIAEKSAAAPVRFAAGALGVAPRGAMGEEPAAWPALVPDCTTNFLNASVAAAAPATTVVRVEVPPGRAVALRRCRAPLVGSDVSSSMWHVRLVLAMGRSSAVALEAWDVALGGVTIEGPAGNASSVVDALVVVTAGSRILARTAGARAASHGAADDVHALSVVAGSDASVSGLGMVVTEGSQVRAVHDGAGTLYSSACSVRAEPALPPGPTGRHRASLAMDRVRIVITGGSTVEATSAQRRRRRSEGGNKACRAHTATIQALPGARVDAARLLVAVLNGSTVAASGDVSSSAAGGIGVSSGLERGTPGGDPSPFLATTTVAASQVAIVAAGPNTTVRVTIKRGGGAGSSAMGVAADGPGAVAVMANATVSALGPSTNVAVLIAGGGGGREGASAMGVAAAYGAMAGMPNATVYAAGPNTTVVVRIAGGG